MPHSEGDMLQSAHNLAAQSTEPGTETSMFRVPDENDKSVARKEHLASFTSHLTAGLRESAGPMQWKGGGCEGLIPYSSGVQTDRTIFHECELGDLIA